MMLQVSALVVALMASARIGLRLGYGQYFAGSGDDLYDVRESDRLKRLALVLGVSGYWVYIAVAISVGVGLGISSYSSSSKCLPHTWLLTAVVSLVSSFTVVLDHPMRSPSHPPPRVFSLDTHIPSLPPTATNHVTL